MKKYQLTIRTCLAVFITGWIAVAAVHAQQNEESGVEVEMEGPDAVPVDEGAEEVEPVPPKPLGALFAQLGGATARERIDAQQKLIQQLADDELRDKVRDRAVELYSDSEDPEVWLRVREILKSYVSEHSDFGPRRGFLGVLHGLTEYPDEKGMIRRAVIVEMVVPDTPAEKAKLRSGDLILKIDEVDLDSPHGDLSFYRYIFMQRGGKEVKLKILRDWKIFELDATLANRPVELFGQRYREQRSPDELLRAWLNERKIELR